MAWSVHLIDETALVVTAGVITAGDLGPLTTAAPPRPYGHRRNDIATGTVTFRTFDPLAVTDFVLGTDHTSTRSFAIYEDSTLRFWGMPGQAVVDLDRQEVTLQLTSLESLFKRKVFGRADRTNQLLDGGFEGPDLSNWDEVDPGGVATFSLDSDAIEGTNSLEVVATAAGAYLSQTLSATINHDYPPGLVLNVVAYFKIDSGSTFPADTALMELVTTGAHPDSPIFSSYIPEAITYDTWIRAECEQLISADVTWTVEVHLGSVDGTIRWDNVRAVYPDSTGAGAGDDVADLVFNMATYLQDGPSGQSDELVTIDTPPTGITLTVARAFQHSDHEEGWQSFVDVCDEFGVDIWVGEDRELHLAAPRGTTRSDLAVTIQIVSGEVDATCDLAGVEVVAPGKVTYDPTQEFSSVIVCGEGEDFDREESGAVDTSEMGGKVRTKFIRGPVSGGPRSLDLLAGQYLARFMRPAALPSLTFKFTDLGDVPSPGDLIPVTIDFGCVQYADDLKVEVVTVDPIGHEVEITFDREG